MRRLLIAVVVCTAFLAAAGSASAHAILESSVPAADANVATAPGSAVLSFSEPLELARGRAAEAIVEDGSTASAAPARSGRDRSTVVIPLRSGLGEGTYTVRFSVIGADGHVIPGIFVSPGAGWPLTVGATGDGRSGPDDRTVSLRGLTRRGKVPREP